MMFRHTLNRLFSLHIGLKLQYFRIVIMNRFLYLIIGALIVVVAGFSYYTYKQEKQPSGIELKLNENGVSVDQH